MPELDLLVPGFGWLVPGVIAGSGIPGRGMGPKAAAAYDLVRAQGIDLVVSLLEEAPPWEVLRAAGLDGMHFPIPDHGTPADLDAFAAFIDAVQARIASGSAALVHCYAGIGRTGLFLAGWLARHRGLSPEDAVRELRRKRPRSIETTGQLLAVAALAASPQNKL